MSKFGDNNGETVIELVEECYRLLFSSDNDYTIVILDTNGQVISWNDGASRLTGFRSEDIVGRHFSAFYPPEAILIGKPAFALQQATTVGRFEEECWRLRADGTLFFARILIRALRDEKRQLRGFAEITREYSEQKQAEAKLREDEERFHLLLTGIIKDYAIVMLDQTGHFASWNEGARQASGGCEASEVMGEHLSMFYTEEERAAGKPELELSIAQETGRCESEGWRVLKDLSRIFVETSITPIYSANGALYGFTRISRNITERKIAHEKVAEMKLRLSLALESSDIGVWDLDIDSKTVWRSEKHDEIMGIDPAFKDWNIDSFFAQVVPEDRELVHQAVDLTKENVRFSNTCRIIRGDGALRWITGHGDVIRNDQGVATRIIGTVIDVTDRKDQEERHRLMSVMQEREDFMATLTHDMKNPLLGANRVLRSMSSGQVGQLTEQQSSLLDALTESNSGVLSLISNLIEVYRMEKEANALLLSDVHLNKLLKASIARIKSYAHLREIKVTLNAPINLGPAWADSAAVSRVVENLLDNALKFTPKGGAVKVTLSEREEVVVVEIEDNGPGIAPDEQERLFKRFSQGEAGKRFTGGSGLGLYLCKQIVEAHHGKISCESVVGEFTIFRFSLPVKRKSAR